MGDTAIQVDSLPIDEYLGPNAEFYSVYEGLPGHDGRWIFDREPAPLKPVYCLQVAQDLHGTSRLNLLVNYLVLQKSTPPEEPCPFIDVFVRVGVLILDREIEGAIGPIVFRRLLQEWQASFLRWRMEDYTHYLVLMYE